MNSDNDVFIWIDESWNEIGRPFKKQISVSKKQEDYAYICINNLQSLVLCRIVLWLQKKRLAWKKFESLKRKKKKKYDAILKVINENIINEVKNIMSQATIFEI